MQRSLSKVLQFSHNSTRTLYTPHVVSLPPHKYQINARCCSSHTTDTTQQHHHHQPKKSLDEETHTTIDIAKCKPMKFIEFTCNICNQRVAKTFSKHSYEKGVVIIQCDGCKNMHLIADNLGFTGHAEKNVEDIALKRGDTIRTEWEGELLQTTQKPGLKNN